MKNDIESRIMELVKRYEDEWKSLRDYKSRIEELRQRGKNGIVANNEWSDLTDEIYTQRTKVERVKEELLELLIDNKVLEIKSPDLRNKLKNISAEIKDYYKDNPYERWETIGPLNDEEWEDWIDVISSGIYDRPWSDLLHQLIQKIDPKGFGDRGFELTTIILNANIPLEFHHLFKDLEMSYRFGLFNSVMICCRSIIEIGIKKYQEDKNNEGDLEKLINSLEKKALFNKKELQKAHFVRITTNSVLHEGHIVTQKEAFQGIKNTHFVIKRLFGND